jgi:hypothetical protein
VVTPALLVNAREHALKLAIGSNTFIGTHGQRH